MARKRRLDAVISFKLRMPEALRQKIEAEAGKANRSMNSEILWRLGQTFEEKWQRFIAGVEDRAKRDRESLERFLQDPEKQKMMAQIFEEHGILKRKE
jgi:hypothetical protein